MSALRIGRRLVLGGAGALVGLPALEALWPSRAFAQPMTPRKNLIVYYVPNGMPMPAWTPADDGVHSPILAPLQPHAQKLLVISGLANRPAEGPAGHAQGTAGFLTCRKVVQTEGANIRNGVSMDQLAAEQLSRGLRFKSLQLATEGGGNVGNCEQGFSCAYQRNISWASETTPLPRMVDPQAVFDRLFAGADADASARERERRRRLHKSVLDVVANDARVLQSKLGRTDRAKLEEYLSGIRELEVRMEAAAQAARCEAAGERPAQPAGFPEHVALMNELMALALQCDATAVITFMLNNSATQRNFAFIGASGAHHELSHHQGDPEKLKAVEAIGRWEIAQLAALLDRLAAVARPDGTTLLDETLVLFSSEIGDGDTHAHHDLPVLLAGGGGGLTMGRHLRLGSEVPLANLYMALLERFGAPVSTFGDDGTQALGGLS